MLLQAIIQDTSRGAVQSESSLSRSRRNRLPNVDRNVFAVVCPIARRQRLIMREIALVIDRVNTGRNKAFGWGKWVTRSAKQCLGDAFAEIPLVERIKRGLNSHCQASRWSGAAT